MSDAVTIINKILAIYSLLLIIFGTIGNLLSFIICLRGNLRKVPTFVYLSFMLFTDSVALYFWNLNHFVSTFFGYVIDGINIHWCKLFIILQLFSFQASAWLLVAMTMERYLSVQVKNWRSVYFNSKKAAVTAGLIVMLAFGFNIHQAFTIDYEMPVNKTFDAGCYSNPMHQFWQYVHVYVYSIIPFSFLLVSNILMVYKTLKNSNKIASTSSQTESKRRTMSFTIFTMTIAFVLLTLPTTIAGGYFLGELLSSAKGYTVLFFCDSLAYSYHALNFIVFLLTNKQFSREFRRLVFNLISLNFKALNETVTQTRGTTTATAPKYT